MCVIPFIVKLIYNVCKKQILLCSTQTYRYPQLPSMQIYFYKCKHTYISALWKTVNSASCKYLKMQLQQFNFETNENCMVSLLKENQTYNFYSCKKVFTFIGQQITYVTSSCCSDKFQQISPLYKLVVCSKRSTPGSNKLRYLVAI